VEDRSGVDSPLVLRGGETDDFLGRIITKPGVVLGVLFLTTLVQIVQHGANIRYWILLVGSVLAGISLVAFGLLIVIDAGRKRRGVGPMLVALGAFVPYLFGCYLVFYEGLWRLRTLVAEFSILTVVISLLFVVGGYLVVNGTYHMSEFGRQVDEGRIVIEESKAV
jgi:hypothetical protein